MAWRIHPTEVPVPHRCDLPGERSLCHLPEFPEVVFVTSNVGGAIWQCDCGRYWQGRRVHEWWPVSARFARRRLRQHDRANPQTSADQRQGDAGS